MCILVLLPLLVMACDGARILALVPFPTRSHWMVIEPLFQELSAKGHQVTVFSSYPQKQSSPNYTDVDCSATVSTNINTFSVEMIKKYLPNPWMTTMFINDYHETTCKVLESPEIQSILKYKNQYDLLITEVFGSDCFTYVAYKLEIPLISFTTSTALPWSAERVGMPDNPSYIPSYLVNFRPPMNLWQRIYNSVVLVYAKFWHYYVFSKRTQTLVEEIFGENLPPLQDVVANTSMLFVNSYHALSQSRPFPPNVIEVGGIHVKESKPIPEDLKNILDKAKKGAIVMSFGSLVRSSALSKSIIKMFLNVFSKIPQTVIFKFEEDLPEAPSNVIVRKWLPQRDIIEHEKVIAVICHGGLGSLIETVFVGKPMIGIPFFSDQYGNIEAVVRRGAGIQLDFENLSEENIREAVNEIVNNPTYKENMKRLSQQFQDRPMTPLQTAVYWTEYVIRHQGAPHLQPASVHLPLYQYLLLDVIAVLAISLSTMFFILYWLIKQLFFVLTKEYSIKQYYKFKEN